MHAVVQSRIGRPEAIFLAARGRHIDGEIRQGDAPADSPRRPSRGRRPTHFRLSTETRLKMNGRILSSMGRLSEAGGPGVRCSQVLKFFEDINDRFGYTWPRYCLLIIGTGGTDNSFTKEDL